MRLAKARALVPSAANANGDVAAEIFDRLDRAVHPVEIVKELRVHPDVVNGFVAQWAAMRKATSLTADEGRAVARALGVIGVLPGSQLEANIKRAIGRARSICRGCEENRATQCDECVTHRLRRIRKQMQHDQAPRAAVRASPASNTVPPARAPAAETTPAQRDDEPSGGSAPT